MIQTKVDHERKWYSRSESAKYLDFFERFLPVCVTITIRKVLHHQTSLTYVVKTCIILQPSTREHAEQSVRLTLISRRLLQYPRAIRPQDRGMLNFGAFGRDSLLMNATCSSGARYSRLLLPCLIARTEYSDSSILARG